VLGLLGLAGSGLLIAADRSPLYQVKVITVVQKVEGVGAQHRHALLIVGIAAAVMALGAAISIRAAIVAELLLGIAALVIILRHDPHDVHSAGVIGQAFADATASPRDGYYLETIGAVLLVAASGLHLLLVGVSGLHWRRRRSRGPASPPG
jgi:hypothetical protein